MIASVYILFCTITGFFAFFALSQIAVYMAFGSSLQETIGGEADSRFALEELGFAFVGLLAGFATGVKTGNWAWRKIKALFS